MLCEAVYAYGTTIDTRPSIRVWYRKTYHTRMVRTVRVRYVPYAYGMKYAYGTQQSQPIQTLLIYPKYSQLAKCCCFYRRGSRAVAVRIIFTWRYQYDNSYKKHYSVNNF